MLQRAMPNSHLSGWEKNTKQVIFATKYGTLCLFSWTDHARLTENLETNILYGEGGGWGLRHPPVAHQDDVQVRPFSSKLFIAKPMLLLYTYKPGINLAN